ncbi:hypothetical protein [Capnocytophaga canimorsus]|uniref:hypothetical protein n=1 Tax=Capnocytophaga canimorsus TaxID=28188 RepID=UPI0037D4AF6D
MKEKIKTIQEKTEIPKLYQKDFQIIIEDKKPAITNFYILCKKNTFTKEEIEKFAWDFRKNYDSVCNIHIYDSEDITKIVNVFDSDLISEEDYIKKAEHFVATLFFTDDFLWYPFKDHTYNELKSPKK